MWSPVTAICRKFGTARQLQAYVMAPAATTHWSYSVLVLVAKYSKRHDTATWLQCSTQGCITPEKAGRTPDKQRLTKLDTQLGLQPTTVASVTLDTQPTTVASAILDTQPTTVVSATLDTQPTTVASVTLDTQPATAASVTLDTQPTTSASVTLDTQPTTLASVTLDTQPTIVASVTLDTQPTTSASVTLDTQPTTAASVTLDTQPTTVASVTLDTQPTTAASVTLDTQPTIVASVTLDTQPTTSASVTLDTQPTTAASVTLDTQPTTAASVTLDTQPTTVASVTLDTQPTTAASSSADIQPAAAAHATHGPDSWGGDCEGHAPPPPLPLESHNVAPFVSASPVLRRMVALGVDVSGWERRRGVAQFVMRLDFERDVQRHLVWLHDVGVPADRLGGFVSENPLIFKERLDDLQVRINYLQAKRFSPDQVTRVVSHNPFWLMFSTERIDRRLGFFSQMFHLKAAEVRHLAARCPVIITSNLFHVKISQFTIKEEFGFTSQEMKEMLLEKPGLWMLSRIALQERLQFLHNTMGLSHQLIAGSPGVLTYRAVRVRQRHLMLHMLGRHQYDKSRPGYVSLDSLVGTTDEEFCRRVAKVPVATYNEFLKTL